MSEKKIQRVVICHLSWKGEPTPQHGIFILKKARKNYKCTYPDCDNEIKKGDLYYTEITPKSTITPILCYLRERQKEIYWTQRNKV